MIFKKFPGHTADEISHYAAKPLGDIKPRRVIIFAGTNDIGREVQLGRTVNEYQVVESIMKTARLARDMGAESVQKSHRKSEQFVGGHLCDRRLPLYGSIRHITTSYIR